MEKAFNDIYKQPDEQRLLAELVKNTREQPEFLHWFLNQHEVMDVT